MYCSRNSTASTVRRSWGLRFLPSKLQIPVEMATQLILTLSCFPPFSLIPQMAILSETHSAYPIVSYLTSHILGNVREVASRCLPPCVFMETTSPASVLKPKNV